MNFRTRIDLTNRQAKQYEKTDISLSGTSTFGLPYSALTTGPDLSMTAVTFTDALAESTYSGNTGTTAYNWEYPIMSVNEGQLSALTPTNSGTTQNTIPNWVGYDMFTTVDGYTGYTSYSALTYDIDVSTMVDSGGAYSGLVYSYLTVYSASSVDYTGSTVWVDVSGKTRTDEIIITKGAVNGYVLKSDADGLGSWQVDTSGSIFTGNTSATCISDIFVSNVHSCSPLYINPLDEGDIFIGSSSAFTFDLTNQRFGLGKSPDYPLDIVVGTALLQARTSVSGNHLFMSGATTGLTQFAVTSIDVGGSIGVRGTSDTIFNGYGKQGDMFIYSGIDSNGLNFISQPGTGTDDFIRFFAGQGAGAAGVADLYIQGSGATRGYVAFGHSIPTEKVDILGNIKMVDGNEQNGYVLTSDVNGVGTWQAAGAGSSPWIAGTGVNSAILDGGTNVATGTLSVAEGLNTDASGERAHAEGNATIAAGDNSHSEGWETYANAIASHAEGFQTSAVTAYAHAEGGLTHAEGAGAHAEGRETVAIGLASHAEGYQTSATTLYSHSEGRVTLASGDDSHAEGYSTIASGVRSHAEGDLTRATGKASHAEGNGCIASNLGAHAEGDGCDATGFASHAQGVGCISSGNGSHSEGASTIASGGTSHAEGVSTIAGGTYTHAEGVNSQSYGYASHVQGSFCVASGYTTHAGGTNCVAIGDYSFVHGKNSDATGDNITVFGAGISGTIDNTVYVPDLVIDGLNSTDPLATNVSGLIVAGASDARLKTNIKPLVSALDKVKNLRGVSYEWTEESNMGAGVKKYGLIAQEVQEVIPDMVRVRAKGDGMLTLAYTEVVPWLIEAVKELASGSTLINNIVLETQTIAAEDNNIELNYGGNHETAVGGGVTVLDGVKDGVNSEIKTDENGNWVMNPPLVRKQYTPTSSNDENGNKGETVWDDDYIYIKTNTGWKRSSLENF